MLKLVIGIAELLDGLFGEQLFECPFLDILCLILSELGNIGNCSCKNGPFVLFASRNYFCQLVDTFVDCFAATTFDYMSVSQDDKS